MGMFGMFGKKSGGVDPVTREYGGDQVGMMKMLAGMPHMMRKPMMKGRINQLLSLPEEKRQESIRDMVGAFHSSKVKDKSRESLIATRVEIIGEIPEGKRRTIIVSRTAALKAAPSLEIQERVLPLVSESARRAFTASWEHVRKTTAK